LVIYPKTIQASVNAELPFMATEEILMAAVQAGGDRQALHEVIRRHSQAAAKQVKDAGQPNDLLDRLSADPAFAKIDFSTLLDPAKFIGRASQQVDRFVKEIIDPIRRNYQPYLSKSADLRV
jgi:adenylosuccinate lyase